ncbi:MAG: NAD(P)/FAD-dependent oxidoreductase [Pseudomonadota bacterium]|nr:NAD(P)/FAD-dependent oxidoreductase [Pseudomonadota bacterium]
MKTQKIAVIGAGTAGLASALVLVKQGHAVTVFEQAAQLENVGAGVLLQPSGLAVFQYLGVLDAALALGARVDSLQGQLADGRLLVDHHYTDLMPMDFGLGMHRAALCDVLMQGLATQSIQWEFGASVQRVTTQATGASVQTLSLTGQMSQQNFDAVLIANGAKSKLRPAAWVHLDRPYPWGAVWAILPECEQLDRHVLHQFYHGTQTMMGILPTGAIPELPNQRLSSLFWSIPTAQFATWGQNTAQIADWIAAVAQHWPQAAAWLSDVVQSPTQFLRAEYRDVILSHFGEGRLGVLGDAAHAMSPQLGQGVNMALLDAWALGQAMRTARNWDQVWHTYHQLRVPSIRFYQMMSRQLTPLYQSDRRSLGVLRDMAFPWMYQVPWLRREMAKTISGFKMGALRELDRTLLMPEPPTIPHDQKIPF